MTSTSCLKPLMASASENGVCAQSALEWTKPTTASPLVVNCVAGESFPTHPTGTITLPFQKVDHPRISITSAIIGNGGRLNAALPGSPLTEGLIVFLKRLKDHTVLLCESLSSNITWTYCFSQFQSFEKTSFIMKFYP